MQVTNPAVVGRGVELGYNGSAAVAASDFEIPRGGITTLIGPNGSGKSTLLGGIAGLLRPLRGSIEVVPVDGRKARVAYVMQTTQVNEALPVTVREVVTMGRYSTVGAYRRLGAEDRAAVVRAMDRTGVTHLAHRHLGELSGGQRQRVFVAQGIAQEHDLMLLDEPLTGLDLTAAEAIDRIVHDEHHRGCTIVLTTHDLTAARAADHVILMAGRVVASGPPEAALTTDHLVEAYGASLLHLEDGRIFVDDPAHRPVTGRHVHLERSIHVEPGEHVERRDR
jgi:manganese transport system ATP-binding protein